MFPEKKSVLLYLKIYLFGIYFKSFFLSRKVSLRLRSKNAVAESRVSDPCSIALLTLCKNNSSNNNNKSYSSSSSRKSVLTDSRILRSKSSSTESDIMTAGRFSVIILLPRNWNKGFSPSTPSNCILRL